MGVLLVGASGLTREVLAVERAIAPFRTIWIVDDDPARWGQEMDGAAVVGGLEEVKRYDDSEIVVCAEQPSARRRLVARLSQLGVADEQYTRVIHPGVDIPNGCTVGDGSILLANVVLTVDIAVGRHVVIMPNVTLTHDDVVEDYATLGAGVSLGSNVRVGSGACLGMNSSVDDGLAVGENAMLGMGSALMSELPRGGTAFGVPARTSWPTRDVSALAPSARDWS
ncbi:MAG TPA: acetyltransferase [Nocardioidaceae bacterium]|nr:acetyltransferase [Nocardioidaceae bacterium]